MRNCLPGAKAADLSRHLDGTMFSVGEELVIVVHIGTNDLWKDRREVLEAKFRLVDKRLKSQDLHVGIL